MKVVPINTETSIADLLAQTIEIFAKMEATLLSMEGTLAKSTTLRGRYKPKDFSHSPRIILREPRRLDGSNMPSLQW